MNFIHFSKKAIVTPLFALIHLPHVRLSSLHLMFERLNLLIYTVSILSILRTHF